NGDVAVCHPGGFNLVHRYIAVGVTRAGIHSHDTEDPGNGLNMWVLVDEYADWPQIMVRDRYLLLNHNNLGQGQSHLHVFNADDLAAGKQNLTALQVPGWTYTADDFNVDAVDWSAGTTVGVTLTTPTYFTSMHGGSGGLIYMVAGSGNYLVVYA